MNQEVRNSNPLFTLKGVARPLMTFVMTLMLALSSLTASAHCDSYDGPTIKDALRALETNNVNLVYKWIQKEQEPEITALFNQTYRLRKGDKQVYALVEKHFLETLVRLHRATEGAPFSGLKPAGSASKIVQMSDQAIAAGSVDDLLGKLNNHINTILRTKYQKVLELDKVKNSSPEQGRAYVAAYVDYTHSIEALHDLLLHGSAHHEH